MKKQAPAWMIPLLALLLAGLFAPQPESAAAPIVDRHQEQAALVWSDSLPFVGSLMRLPRQVLSTFCIEPSQPMPYPSAHGEVIIAEDTALTWEDTGD